MVADSWNETRAWISRSQEGDREAFDHVVRRYEGRIQAWVRPQIGEHLQHLVEVEDVTQDTFVRAFQLVDRFEWRNEPAFWGWLSGIARNVIRHSYRSTARRNRLTTKLSGLGVLREAGPEAQIVRRSEDEELMLALATLRDADQEILRLRVWEELSVPEIARVVGLSVAAAEKRVARAFERLERAARSRSILALRAEGGER